MNIAIRTAIAIVAASVATSATAQSTGYYARSVVAPRTGPTASSEPSVPAGYAKCGALAQNRWEGSYAPGRSYQTTPSQTYMLGTAVATAAAAQKLCQDHLATLPKGTIGICLWQADTGANYKVQFATEKVTGPFGYSGAWGSDCSL